MPLDDKKTNTTGDALTVQDIRNLKAQLTSAAPTGNKSGMYATYYASYGMPNWIGSPFMTRHASDPVVPTPRSESQDPIIGYRVWSLNADCLLVSSVKKIVWPARQRMVRGTKDEDLGLGIHAAKLPDRIVNPPVYDNDNIEDSLAVMSSAIFGEEQGLWDEYKGQVAGEVALWGEVKEFKHGYTAEFAYPKRLWVPETMDVLRIMQIEKNYGVPVGIRADLGVHKKSQLDMMMIATMFNYRPTFHLPTKTGTNRVYFQYPTSIIKPMTPEEKKSLEAVKKEPEGIDATQIGPFQYKDGKETLDKSKDKV